MHAKKTRDRKKELLEISENVIIKMERESFLLREYLGTFFLFVNILFIHFFFLSESHYNVYASDTY